jgi:hypothetical protein
VKGIIGVILGVILLVALFSHSGHHSSSGGASSSSDSHLELVKHRSFCVEIPASATLRFFFAVRNTGSAAGSVDARPWRRYSDGSVNESVLDTVTVKVRAGATKRFTAQFNYNALQHDVLGCGFYWGDSLNVSRIRVDR